MNLCKRMFAITLWFVLAGMSAASICGQDAATRSDGGASAQPAQRDRALLDLIRTTQELAQKSQAELESARRQNESIQLQLEQTRRELQQLREEMNRLRSAVLSALPSAPSSAGAERASGRENENQPPTATAAAGPAAGKEPAEDQVEINKAQITELNQTKVESDSRFKVRLFGTILNNTYYNTSDGTDEAVPEAAPTKAELAHEGGHNLGATFRQTNFGFALTGPKVGSARLSASVDFDFFGGSEESYDGYMLGSLRMRTAAARLDGPRTSLAFGLMSPIISPLDPTSLASVYYPAFGESGNLWQWTPQFTLERRAQVSEGSRFIFQGGLLMPFGESIGGEDLQGRLGYESRVAFSHKIDDERRFEIGAGGFFHPYSLGFGRSVNAYAATSDWLIPVARRLELRGEAYYGRGNSLSIIGGGDIASVFALTGPLEDPLTAIRGIHSIGGWTQLKAKAAPRLEFNAAFGLDDPRDRDVYSGLFDKNTRLKNQACSVNSIFRLSQNFLFSLEYRRLWTTYPDGRTTNDHINLAIGYLF